MKRILRTGYSKIKLLLYVDAHKACIMVVKCNFSKIISLQLKEMQDSRRKEYRRGIKIIDRRGIIAQIESAMYRDRD